MESTLTTEQLTKASEWYKAHKEHVDKLVKDIKNPYPPTDTEDKNSPALWKANHWAWFLNK